MSQTVSSLAFLACFAGAWIGLCAADKPLPPGVSVSGTLRTSPTGNIDFGKTSVQFDADKKPKDDSFAKTDQPKLDEQFQGKAPIDLKDWNGRMLYQQGDKKAGIDTGQSKEFKTLKEKMLDYTADRYKTKEYESSKQLDPRYDKATQRDNFLVAKYRDAWTAHLGATEADMENFSKQLSMRDINRYQFRSSHSSAPGLPIQVAGSGNGQSVEKQLFSNYDNSPRSTGSIRAMPKPTSLPSATPDAEKRLGTLGSRGFIKPNAVDNSKNTPPPGMIPRSAKLGKPVMGEWQATSRVLD